MTQRRRIVLKIGEIRQKVEDDELNNKSEFQQAYIESLLKEEAYAKGINDSSNNNNNKHSSKNNQNSKNANNSQNTGIFNAVIQGHNQIDEPTNNNNEFFQQSGQGCSSDQYLPNSKAQQHVFKRIQCVSEKEKSEIQKFILTKKQQQQKLMRTAEGYILEMSQAQQTRQKILNGMLQANKSSKTCSVKASPEKPKSQEQQQEQCEEIEKQQQNHNNLNNSAAGNIQQDASPPIVVDPCGDNTAGTTASNFEALFPLKNSASSEKHKKININSRRRICSSNGRRDWNERKFKQLIPAQRGQQITEQGASQQQQSTQDMKDMSEAIVEGTPIRQRCLFKHPALATAVQQKNRSVSSNCNQQRAALKQQRFHISFNGFFSNTKEEKQQQQQQQQSLPNNSNIILHGSNTQYCKSHSSQLLSQAPTQEQPRTPSKLSTTNEIIINLSEKSKTCTPLKLEQQQQQQRHVCQSAIAPQAESYLNDSLPTTNWLTEIQESSSMQNQKYKSQHNKQQEEKQLEQQQQQQIQQPVQKLKNITKSNLNSSNNNHLQIPVKHRALTESVRIQTEPSYSSSIENNETTPKRLQHRPFSGKHSTSIAETQQLKQQILGNTRRNQIDSLLQYFNSVAVFDNSSQQLKQTEQQSYQAMTNKGNDNNQFSFKFSSSVSNNNYTDKQYPNLSTTAPLFHKPNLTLGTFEINNNNNSSQLPQSSKSVRSRALPMTPNKLATMSLLCQKPQQQTNNEQRTQDKLTNLAKTADTVATLQRSVLSLLSSGSMGQISSISSSSNASSANIAPKYNQTCKTPIANAESFWNQTEEPKHFSDNKESQLQLKKTTIEDLNSVNFQSAKLKKYPKKRSMTAVNGRKIHKFTDKNITNNNEIGSSIDSTELFVKRSRRLIEKSGKDPENFSTLAITLDSITLPQQSNQNMSHSPLFLHKSFVLPK